MANAMYTSAKVALWSGDIDLTADDIRVQLIDSADYTFSAAHDFLDDVPSGARVGAATALSGESVAAVSTSAVFDASDTTITGVTGDQLEACVIYKHTGTEGTSHLIAYIDTFASGAPLTPDGGNVVVTWPAGGILSY